MKTQMKKHVVHVLGLGDVGSTLAVGLKLMGGDIIGSLGVYDPDLSRVRRWEMELGQIIVNPDMAVCAVKKEALFHCDVLVFCASKGIPDVSVTSGDVRTVQFDANARILSAYISQADEARFQGTLAIVSDPVDLLCMWALHTTHALSPSQIMGFGLGVMDGRARYLSKRMGLPYEQRGRLYGPHGSGLVVSADIASEDQSASLKLTDAVVTANLQMREIGYKPYVAPALSSGAASIVAMLRGEWHYSATYEKELYWGCRNRRLADGQCAYEQLPISEALAMRIESAKRELRDTWRRLNS